MSCEQLLLDLLRLSAVEISDRGHVRDVEVTGFECSSTFLNRPCSLDATMTPLHITKPHLAERGVFPVFATQRPMFSVGERVGRGAVLVDAARLGLADG